MDDTAFPGTLYVVATPLGNLEDITFRAVKILEQVDLIAAEDTRHSKRLLNHYGIQTRLVSCHEHNEVKKAPQLIAHLKNGRDIALISDAGTPSISDPGYTLVKAAAQEKISVIPIPGCSAAIAGLSVAGLPTDAFLFTGFLPKKQQKQKQALEALKSQTATLIFYESPKRIKSLIGHMITIFGDRQACLAREITKLHEEYIRGSLSHILEKLTLKETIKGECSLFVQGDNLKADLITEEQLEEKILSELKTENCRTLDLAKKLSKAYGLSKKEVYNKIIQMQQTTLLS